MTTFVLIDPKTNNLMRGYANTWYNTERGAKISAASIFKKTGIKCVPISYEDFELYHNPLVEVISLMSGKPVLIRKSERGGCLDVSQERYWCMQDLTLHHQITTFVMIY